MRILTGAPGNGPAPGGHGAGEEAAGGGESPVELVLKYLGLADALARRYRVPGGDVEDLRQAARLGLVTAARRYRPGAGHGFLPYAVPTITGSIKRHLRDTSWVVRPPRSLQELRLRVNRARDGIAQDLGREPSRAELGQAAGCSADDVTQALGANRAMGGVPIEPLDSTGEAEDVRAAHIVPVDDPGFEAVEQRLLVAAALKGASADDRRLVRLRFVDELTQAQIAAVLGVSQMQVSRLLRRLLDRMRLRIAA